MTDTAARTKSDADIEIARPNDNIYLAGNMAPVEHEITAFDLPVTGEIPVELEGRWLRNGPNPFATLDGPPQHWFLGAGMVHGVRLPWRQGRVVPQPLRRCPMAADRTRTSVASPAPRGRWSRPDHLRWR